MRTCCCLLTLVIGCLAVAHGQQDSMPPAERITAARAAGDYLVRILDEEGRFIYLVKPFKGELAETYNMLRHAGTIYALCQLYEATQEERYREAARRAANLLERFIRQETVDGKAQKVLVSDYSFTFSGQRQGLVIKTGGCALAVVALLSIDQAFGTARYRETALALGDYLVSTQFENGNIRSKYLLDEARWDSWQSNYYPGETLVALAMLQARYPREHLVEPIVRLQLYLAANWAVSNLDPGLEVRDFDHWSLIGFRTGFEILSDDVLARFSPPDHRWTRQELLDTARQYCQDELRRQLVDTENILHGDLVPTRGETTPTATRLEGIVSVYHLLRESGHDVTAWDVPIQRALRFLQRGQYKRDISDRVRLNIAGGVRRSVGIMSRHGAEIRIDYCQHAISAWLSYPGK